MSISRPIRLILVGLVLLLIVVLAWFFLLSPLRSDIKDAEASIQRELDTLTAAQTQLARSEAIREEGEKNRSLLLQLAKMVPEGEQIPSLLVQIQDLADRAGIDFVSITPGAPMQTNSFDVIPLDVEFVGTYFDISDFVYRAEQMVAGPGRLLAVKSIELGLSQASDSATVGWDVSPALSAKITLYAFDTAGSAKDSSGTAAPQAPETSPDSDQESNPQGDSVSFAADERGMA